ncbi:MAG TPA: hypothetical protein VLA05_12645, partial [Coriobacteriia bacterium]|nr:hypothetical protein [Coriobacteriia bacterium]
GTKHYEIWRNGVLLTTTNSTSYTANGLSPATAYNFVVKVVDNAGWTSESSHTVSLTIPGVNITGPSKVTWGQSVTATVSAQVGGSAEGIAVALETRTDETDWTRTTEKTTDENGQAAFTFLPTSRTYYRGVAVVSDAKSETSTVTVDPYLTIEAPVDVERKTTFTIRGSLKPLHESTDRVSIQFFLGDKLVKTVPAVETTYTESPGVVYTRYSAKTALTTPAAFTVKAVVAETNGLNAVSSESKTLYVNRPTLSMYSNRTSVTYSTPATIYGWLKARSGGAIKDQRVAVERSTDGGKTWKWLKTVRTSSTGKLSLSVKPSSDTLFRFRYPGSTYHMPRISSSKLITPHMQITIPQDDDGDGKVDALPGDMVGFTEPWRLPVGWHRLKVTSSNKLRSIAVGRITSDGDVTVAWWDVVPADTEMTYKFYAPKDNARYFIQVENYSKASYVEIELW